MSNAEELKKQREDLQDKIKQVEEMIGKRLSWKDSQFYIEKYKEEIRVLDNKIARIELGEDAVSALKVKKQQLQDRLKALEEMKRKGDVSDKVYKEKKKDIAKEIEQVEREVVETM